MEFRRRPCVVAAASRPGCHFRPVMVVGAPQQPALIASSRPDLAALAVSGSLARGNETLL
jgi:hypothetical protein